MLVHCYPLVGFPGVYLIFEQARRLPAIICSLFSCYQLDLSQIQYTAALGLPAHCLLPAAVKGRILWARLPIRDNNFL